ncbi:MAG: transcriptional regulator NrdR, partial [Thermovirgaceae bacterium]|nr:transcriptional regulator NrdR [Thermovirgaceae bacterium]
QGEISSLRVGSLAMNELRDINKVAYVRFASVYREFTDISSFVDEISRLHEERNGHI